MLVIVLIVLLFVVLFQDLFSRAVFWPVFPILFVLGCVENYSEFIIQDILISVAFILFLLVSLTLYLSVKTKKLIPIWKGFFSLGDIFMIIAITPLFSWYNYIFFFTFATIGVLIVYALTYYFIKDKTVPYAGYLSLFVIFFLIFPSDFNQLFIVIGG